MINTVRGIIAFIRVSRDLHRLDEIINVSQRLVKIPILERAVALVRKMGGYAERSLTERPRVGKLSLEHLKALPAGTVGRGLADYLIQNNLNPEDIPTIEADTPELFLRAHLYETHDIWHVITGFDTTVAGEIGLQAFYLAQIPVPLNSLILAANFINLAFFCPDERERRMDELIRGWQTGRKSRPLFGMEWKTLWGTPLEKVRKDLGLI